jgi:hypothetical protein
MQHDTGITDNDGRRRDVSRRHGFVERIVKTVEGCEKGNDRVAFAPIYRIPTGYNPTHRSAH